FLAEEIEADLDVAAREVGLRVVEQVPADADHHGEQQRLPEDAAYLLARDERAGARPAGLVRSAGGDVRHAVSRVALRSWNNRSADRRGVEGAALAPLLVHATRNLQRPDVAGVELAVVAHRLDGAYQPVVVEAK